MEKAEQNRNQKTNQSDFSHLVNPDDPVEVQREQETKPARTVSGPGETSVEKNKTGDAGQAMGSQSAANHDEPAAP